MPVAEQTRNSPIIALGHEFKQAACAGRRLGGAWLSLGSSVASEIAVNAGYDWLLIDLEHGNSDYGDLLHQLQAASIATLVRVPAIDRAVFKRVLDLGAHGLMIPQLNNAEDARRCVSYARIPPLGVRGAAKTTRASGYGRHYEHYLGMANDALVIMAQIESRAGIINVEEIAAVDGVDILFVGPTDLEVDLNTAGGLQDPDFRAAVTSVAEAALRHGKAAGVLARTPEQARAYSALGFTCIALGSDRGAIAQGLNRSAAALAELPPRRRDNLG